MLCVGCYRPSSSATGSVYTPRRIASISRRANANSRSNNSPSLLYKSISRCYGLIVGCAFDVPAPCKESPTSSSSSLHHRLSSNHAPDGSASIIREINSIFVPILDKPCADSNSFKAATVSLFRSLISTLLEHLLVFYISLFYTTQCDIPRTHCGTFLKTIECSNILVQNLSLLSRTLFEDLSSFVSLFRTTHNTARGNFSKMPD